jgi:hypothetical protein
VHNKRLTSIVVMREIVCHQRAFEIPIYWGQRARETRSMVTMVGSEFPCHTAEGSLMGMRLRHGKETDDIVQGLLHSNSNPCTVGHQQNVIEIVTFFPFWLRADFTTFEIPFFSHKINETKVAAVQAFKKFQVRVIYPKKI